MDTEKNFSDYTLPELYEYLLTAPDEEVDAIYETIKGKNSKGDFGMLRMPNGTGGLWNGDEPTYTPKKRKKEESEGDPSMESTKGKSERDPSMESTEELKRACLSNTGHICLIKKPKSDEWRKGVITGATFDRRSDKMLYNIKTYEGRRITKAYNSKSLKITDDISKRKRYEREKDDFDVKQKPWTLEEAHQEVDKYIDKVGLPITFYRSYRLMEGRIVGVVHERNKRLVIYKIRSVEKDREPLRMKVATDPSIRYGEPDAFTESVKEKFIRGMFEKRDRACVDIEEKLLKCQERLAGIENRLLKAASQKLEAYQEMRKLLKMKLIRDRTRALKDEIDNKS